MKPFFSYYGTKWRMSKHYPAPVYGTVIEPFAGSAGYSLHYPRRDVILIDRNPYVIGAWRWLISASEVDIRDLPELEPGERVSDYRLPDEAAWLMGFWVNRASTIPKDVMVPWIKPRKYGTNVCAMYKDRAISQVSQIRHWQAYCGDYRQGGGNPEATWFIDAPYQGSHKDWGTNVQRYNREGIGEVDYRKLGEWCRSRNGQVIVCAGMFEDWLPFMEVELKGNHHHGSKYRNTERVWTSRRFPRP